MHAQRLRRYPSVDVGRTLLSAMVMLALGGVAEVCAQGKTAQPQTSKRPWVVIKGSLHDYTGKQDTVVADFDDAKQARHHAARLDEAEKDWTQWTYLVRKRSAVVAGGGRSSQPARTVWESHHGLTPIAYQAKFDELTPKDYRPICVNGFVVGDAVGDAERYTAVWAHHDGPAWVARHGLTSAQYQDTFDTLNAEDYQPICVSGYTAFGETRYAAIWEKSRGWAWEACHGLTSAAYQTKFDDLNDQGYRLICVNGYGVGGEARYAAVWEKRAGPACEARHCLTSNEYKSTSDTLKAQGYRPIWVSGYSVGGVAQFAGIWEKRDGPVWEAHHDLTSAQYQMTFDALNAKGYRPICVSGYCVNADVRYAVIWENSRD
jgi:hypothetical protein